MRRKIIITRLFILLFVLFSSLSKACAGVKVSSKLCEKLLLKPGEEYKGVLKLSNTSEEPQAAKIYQTDYIYNAKGENFYDSPGSVERSNAKWTSVDSKVVVVPARTRINYPYTIKVPADPSLKGSYWSVIMVEEASPPKEVKLEKGFQILTIARYAVQIITTIKDSGNYDLTILDKSVIKENEKSFLQVDLENSGNLIITPKIQMDLFKSGTKEKKQLEAKARSILPGASVRYKIDVSDFELGKYKSMLLFDHGGDAVFGSEWDVEL